MTPTYLSTAWLIGTAPTRCLDSPSESDRPAGSPRSIWPPPVEGWPQSDEAAGDEAGVASSMEGETKRRLAIPPIRPQAPLLSRHPIPAPALALWRPRRHPAAARMPVERADPLLCLSPSERWPDGEGLAREALLPVPLRVNPPADPPPQPLHPVFWGIKSVSISDLKAC